MASGIEKNRGKHPRWVKLTHWMGSLAFLLLVFTGIEILMVHPRLYWGEAGNDLTPALFELPISRNYQHGGWQQNGAFFNAPNSPVSASRTYDIFNQNGWGRSLHFLAAWILVFAGLAYWLISFASRHFSKQLWPAGFSWRLLWQDMKDHFKKQFTLSAYQGYGLLQRITYLIVLFVVAPVMVLTGLTMSPAVTASHPWLLTLFMGAQSARTLHFFAAVILLLFLLVHVVMIVRTGFKKQMIQMTIGS
jgi:thiosulfate reductase cytochrome b subunit